jgi:DUF1365 family protein
VRVLTNLRVLGHVFNPVSWWFCHHEDGSLALVVAEVNNTFGESHCYLLDDLEPGPGHGPRGARVQGFHVSPFLPIDGLATGSPSCSAGRGSPRTSTSATPRAVFDATQDGRPVGVDDRTLARALLTHPLLTLRTVVLIHLQAIRLWRRGCRSTASPSPARPAGGAEHRRTVVPPGDHPDAVPTNPPRAPTTAPTPDPEPSPWTTPPPGRPRHRPRRRRRGARAQHTTCMLSSSRSARSR